MSWEDPENHEDFSYNFMFNFQISQKLGIYEHYDWYFFIGINLLKGKTRHAVVWKFPASCDY